MSTYDPTPDAALVAEWAAIVRGQIGDGYDDDPDSVIAAEVEALAYLLAWGDNVLTQAGAEAYPASAIETLDEHEHALSLPNDSGVTDAERAARVVALTAARGTNDASIGRVLAALGSLGSADLRGPSEIDAPGVFDLWHALSCRLLVSSADYQTPRVRQALGLFLERHLDASRFGADHVAGRRLLATAEGMRYGSTVAADGNPQALGRTTFATLAPYGSTVPKIARCRDFGPGAVFQLDDARKVARQLVTQPGDVIKTAYDPASDLVCVASILVPAGTTKTVEPSGVWTRRYMVCTGQVHTTDVRPGGAAEDGDARRFGPLFCDTTIGGTGNGATIAASLLVFADITVGLKIYNSGASDQYVNIYARASGSYFGGAGTRDPLGLEADTVASIDPAAWATLASAGYTARGGDADAWASSAGGGLVHRLALTPRFVVPASGVTEIVIDSSLDWRDRFVVLSCGGWDHRGYAVIPGMHDADNAATECDQNSTSANYSTHVFGYTGAGHAAGVTSAGQWDIGFGNALALRVFANVTTGALTLAIDASAGPPGFPATCVLDVAAGFQIGAHSTPDYAPNVATPAALDRVDPFEWNLAQDYAVQDYARPEVLASIDVGALPIGLDVYGTPPIGRVVRARRDRLTGYAQDASLPIVRRERGDGGIRLVEEISVGATSAVLLDAAHDWRDRWISYVGEINTSSSYARGFYSGPGASASDFSGSPSRAWGVQIKAAVWLYADAATGYLYAYNPTGSAATQKLYAFGSLHLGGRSVRREAGRASYRAPLGLSSLYLWITAARCVLTTAKGRQVPIEDSRSGVLHSATQINGFQSSGAAAVGFTGSGTVYPWVPGAADRMFPALRLVSTIDQAWSTALTATTYEFFHKGPATIVFAFTCLVDRPWDPNGETTNSQWPIMHNHGGAGAGFQFSIDSVSGVPSWSRFNGAHTEIEYSARSNVRDGRTHYVTIRQTAATGLVEVYVDGQLETQGAAAAITDNASTQLLLGLFGIGFTTGVRPDGYTMAAIDLHDFIAYSASLSDVQLRQLHAHLATTYGGKA